MKYKEALEIGQAVLEQLKPHCYRCEIGGSIRRKKEDVKDIEIIAIPKPYEIGLLESGIATVVNKWELVTGKLPGKNTIRLLPEGIKLDLFFADKTNWGWIFTHRTGSIEYNKRILVRSCSKRGYKLVDGYVTKDGNVIPVPEERDFYKLIGVTYINSEQRDL
jgi:DNA polymerase/3'-5' exonuclease PolX